MVMSQELCQGSAGTWTQNWNWGKTNFLHLQGKSSSQNVLETRPQMCPKEDMSGGGQGKGSGLVVCSCSPEEAELRRQKCEDGHRFEFSLGYRASTRTAWATQKDLVSDSNKILFKNV